MANENDLSLGNIAKKGLGLINEKLSDALRSDSMDGSIQAPLAPEAPRIDSNPTMHCISCGAFMAQPSKFCPECGFPRGINNEQFDKSIAPDIASPANAPLLTRVSQFEGTIHKCPNCGEPIDPFDAVCDSCGHRIAERSVSNSVQVFYIELANIEKTRKKKSLFSNPSDIDIADKQKIALINTFPIPNTIAELSEFMFMAAESIDIEKSKQRSSFSKFWTSYEGDSDKAVSDAWVAKMKQIHHKAKLSFSDDPVFAQIDQVYLEKMSQLNMA